MPGCFLHRSSSPVPYFSRDGETYLAETPLRDLEKTLPLRVLSKEDFESWQKYGWTILKQAVSRDHAKALLDFAWDFQGLDPQRPETWYPEQHHTSDLDRDLYVFGFVEAYHHQLIWDSRQNQRVYDAFVDVWDCEELWVSQDRLNLNPPNVGNRSRSLVPRSDEGFDIELHWDVDTTLAVLPQRVQGLIALNDTSVELGGFQCSPELFHRFDEWRVRQPADRDPIRPDADPAEFPVVRPQLEAGDLLIWNGLLAHGVAANTSESGVRSAQYLAMMPALPTHTELLDARIESWRDLSTPTWNSTLTGHRTRPESQRYGQAELNDLGRRLLGLTPWSER